MTETAETQSEAERYRIHGVKCYSLGKYVQAKQYWEKALAVATEIGDKKGEATDYGNLGTVLYTLGECGKATEHLEKSLAIRNEIGDREGEASSYGNLGIVFQRLGEYGKAKEYLGKALAIEKEIGNREGEGLSYGSLGTLSLSLCEYSKAKEYLQNALVIKKENGDRKGEVSCCLNLGNVFKALREYDKVKEYLEKALAISQEIDDKKGEAESYRDLGTTFYALEEYGKAEEYLVKALAITKEIGNKNMEACAYVNLGTVFHAVREYGKAKEYLEKALEITKENGDREGEAAIYQNVGTVYETIGGYEKAKVYFEKALSITKEIGNREEEGASYGNLGTVYQALGEYGKAREYLEKALAITKEIGDRKGEGASYDNLGTVYQALGEHGKAREYLEKALAITKEIGDRRGEASSYGNLGAVFGSVGEYGKAKEYCEKALAIRKQIGDRVGEGSSYSSLGAVFHSFGEYGKAKECLERALAIRQETGGRECEAGDYQSLGTVFLSLGKCGEAKTYLEKALALRKEIGDRVGEALSYKSLGSLFDSLKEYDKAKEYYNKSLGIFKDIGNVEEQLELHTKVAFSSSLEGNMFEALWNLVDCVSKFEDIRGLNEGYDEFKIPLSDEHSFPFQILSVILVAAGSPTEALYLAELRRARAQADLLSVQYRVTNRVSGDPLSWVGIEKIMEKEKTSFCLYISYFSDRIFLWLLKPNKAITFQLVDSNEQGERSIKDLNKFLRNDITFRKCHILSQEHCEDRSLFPCENEGKSTNQLYEKESPSGFRLLEEDEEEDQESEPTLSLYYQLIIAPVADELDEPEIIIVPDRCFYNVPFAALKDECEKYLSERLRIRIIPSLTTLKIIQDCPLDYHSQTGALIVGDPEVGHVMYKGRLERIPPLPCARKEAEMIGRLLDAKPLVGKHATKQAVLQRINSVSLIHFAAHGNAHRGEIALAPLCPTNSYAQEEDYLLTMADISKVQLRAKLVVLSCCHSASGQVRAEGVVGIARAFLGSGARSVLVSLWALEDSATERLMSCFYEHLVRGESASESLHQAMKWMRSNGYSDVRDWAPFMLIGDDVTFDFAQHSKRVSSIEDN